MMKRILGGIALAALVAGAVQFARAQSPSVPTVLTINNNSDLIQVVPNGAPVVGNVYATPAEINNAPGYKKVSVGQTLNVANGYSGQVFGNYQTYLIFIVPATMPYSYVTLAPAPSDGARDCVVASGGALTSLYVAANSGQSIANNGTAAAGISLSTNTTACFTYSLSNLTWDRS